MIVYVISKMFVPRKINTYIDIFFRSFVMLPKVSGPDATRVTLLRPGRYDPDKYNITQVIAVAHILMKVHGLLYYFYY